MLHIGAINEAPRDVLRYLLPAGVNAAGDKGLTPLGAYLDEIEDEPYNGVLVRYLLGQGQKLKYLPRDLQKLIESEIVEF